MTGWGGSEYRNSCGRDLYKSNFAIHGINTRHNTDYTPPSSRVTVFQKGVFYFGIKVFNHLPSSIKNMSHEEKQFRLVI